MEAREPSRVGFSVQAASLCTAEKVSILILLAIIMALYWWVRAPQL